jgi:hypothetical protein
MIDDQGKENDEREQGQSNKTRNEKESISINARRGESISFF